VTTELVDIRRDGAGSGAIAAPGLLFRVARAGVRTSMYVSIGAVALAALFVLALALGPSFLPYRAYTIESGSMTPTLPIGSEVILAKTSAAQLKPGDVITFREPTRDGTGAIITHRIVRIERKDGKRFFVTKGDANGLADAWRVPATGEGWRYVYRLPWLGYLIAALKLPLIRLAMLATAALALALSILRWVWQTPER
jgi:signal peptidase